MPGSSLFSAALLLLAGLGMGQGPQEAGVFTEESVTVRKVSVPGYFVRAPEGAVLVDGLTRSPEGPDEETLELLETGSRPFQGVDLILATHRHGDHFDTESLARHLTHNPEGVVVTGTVIAGLLAEHPNYATFGDRVEVVDPEPNEIVEREINGFRVKAFLVSHGEPNDDFSLDNLAIMVDLGSTRIFTSGDIVPHGQTEVFRRAALQEEAIDFAFLPFTMFADEYQPEAMSIIDELIQPRHIVATHFREVHRGAFTEALRERYPAALILEEMTGGGPAPVGHVQRHGLLEPTSPRICSPGTTVEGSASTPASASRPPTAPAWSALSGIVPGRPSPWTGSTWSAAAPTRPSTSSPSPTRAAWVQVEGWLSCRNAWIPEPTRRHGEILRSLLPSVGNRSNLVPDAHLAALAMEYGLIHCSTDADFGRFQGLRWRSPLSA